MRTPIQRLRSSGFYRIVRGMIPFQLETAKGNVTVRYATQDDLDALVALDKVCFPLMQEDSIVWGKSQLANHLRLFPDGQIVAECDGRIIGAVSSLIVDMGKDPFRDHTYNGITDGGWFHNHTFEGDTLYGAAVSVHPDFQGVKIGQALYEARRLICQKYNLRRILAGGRLYSYCDFAEKMTPEEYIERVVRDELRDKVLSFQLREGFIVRGVLRNYVTDPLSRNCASLIEWLNPQYKEEQRRESKVRVASVQYQMRRVRDFADFAEQVRYFVDTASQYRSDFLVFPEFFTVQLLSTVKHHAAIEGIRELSRFTQQYLDLMSGLAKDYGLYIVGGSHPLPVGDRLLNTSFLFCPDGARHSQAKLHITPAEKKAWGISGGDDLQVFHTPKAKVGILICYDIEFPEAARCLADDGAEIIFVPFCTDDRPAYLRVRYCAQARAIENQIYVVTSGVIGNLPDVPSMDIHYGQAAVFTPSDFEFARDGILAQADSNVETLLVTDLDLQDLYRAFNEGSVTPRTDRRRDLFEVKYKTKSACEPTTLDAPQFKLPK